MSKKYFYNEESDFCETLEFIQDRIIDDGLTQKEVYKADRVIGSDMFWCNDVFEVGEKGHCGVSCKSYEPRNGKSGICKHNKPVYEHGEKLLITIKR